MASTEQKVSCRDIGDCVILLAMLSDVSLMSAGGAPASEHDLLPLLDQELNRYPSVLLTPGKLVRLCAHFVCRLYEEDVEHWLRDNHSGRSREKREFPTMYMKTDDRMRTCQNMKVERNFLLARSRSMNWNSRPHKVAPS